MSELLPAPPVKGSGLGQTQKDLIAGSVGGMAQVLVGQVSQAIKIPSYTISTRTGFMLIPRSPLILSRSEYRLLQRERMDLRSSAPRGC